MQATITYLLTEQAQRAAMAATGQPVPRKQVLTTDIPAADLDLYDVSESGEVTLNLADASKRQQEWLNGRFVTPLFEFPAVQDAASIGSLLRSRLAAVAAAKEEKARLEHANGEHNRAVTDAAYQQFLADPAARRSIRERLDLRSPADWWPESHAEFAAEINRRAQLDADAKRTAEAAKEATKEAAIADFVAGSSDPLLKQQFAGGLANRADIIALMAAAAFDAAGVPAECDGFTVCQDGDCPCFSTDVTSLPREIYARWKRIALPEGSAARFKACRPCLKGDDGMYEGDDTDEMAGPEEYHAIVTIPSGPFQFTRRIQI